MKLSIEEGEKAVKLARKAIEEYLETGKIIKDRLEGVFSHKRGVFTTLIEHGELRGCIGFPYPVKRLDEAIIESAISAAIDDPRFEPVKRWEMEKIIVEVTILTEPERINARAQDLPKFVEIGKHGLMVKKGLLSGLLLPQVAVEYGMDAEEFLSHTCLKAGLPPDCWLTGVEIYRFEGQIFMEIEPKGAVVELDIKSCQ
ncbi:MAG: TIGR00296 family protein [Archaeoglobaceae archaeon]|nr:TIGR00296 family protein [Archaeoglobaceae archaeon]MDW7990084.1 TIGR00296 family protein [Archaeoglobaceae archaeon]